MSSYGNNMLKNSHLSLRCTREFVKSLFTNIEKQENMLKISLFLRNLQTSWANNQRTFKITNAKLSGYCFYMNTNI